jgi:formate hydrogenlyase subunit 3/multisubunit Na+/H+ antiporter MnhD subunit
MDKIKLITIFLKNSGGISSKRVISLLGTVICFSLLIAGFITGKEIPGFAEVVFIGCLSLYGVEKIPNFWNKN